MKRKELENIITDRFLLNWIASFNLEWLALIKCVFNEHFNFFFVVVVVSSSLSRGWMSQKNNKTKRKKKRRWKTRKSRFFFHHPHHHHLIASVRHILPLIIDLPLSFLSLSLSSFFRMLSVYKYTVLRHRSCCCYLSCTLSRLSVASWNINISHFQINDCSGFYFILFKIDNIHRKMFILSILSLLLCNQLLFAQPPTCYRSSRYLVPQTPGDNGFRITVEGSFKTYVPGRTYKGNDFLFLSHQRECRCWETISFLVSLSGFKSQVYQSVFREFMLIAVPSTWTDEQTYQPIGHFELLPSVGVNDETIQEALISQQNCPGGVTDANPDKSKNSISVNWIAPRHAQGCISFKYVSFISVHVKSIVLWFN